jgi:4-carboxymuconolactone decarboxylase
MERHPPSASHSSPSAPTAEEIERAKKVLFEAGLKVRYEVLDAPYVDAALATAQADPELAWPLQEMVTGGAWGLVWTRPGLERKQRSMLNLAMLCALNRGSELAVHVRGAVRNGVTKKEMSEVFVQVCVYCGMPAGMEGVKVAMRIFKEMEMRGEVDAEGRLVDNDGKTATATATATAAATTTATAEALGGESVVSTPGSRAGYAYYMP